MAEVRPIHALHYDLATVGSLNDVAAPPYDVIDAAQRAELLKRSPYNAVAVDLPKPYDQRGPADSGAPDPYAAAAETIDAWRQAGALVDDPEPAIWAMTQGYTGPDGSSRTRHGILARVRVEDFEAGQVLPHERTLPGPKKDRLDLTRATRHNLSPIFSLATKDPWPLVAAAIAGEAPWGEATDAGGVVTKLWRVGDPDVHAQVTELLADAQLLIADGHHRYETAIAYRDEIGGEGLRELFEISEVETDELDPLGEEGVGVFGLYDSHHKRAFRLRLKDTEALDRQLEGEPEAYRRLDAAILETLVLKGIAGMSEDDILAKRGIGYAKSVTDSLALLDDGAYDVAFILRPIPVDQVRAICESDENMPPKSTYFFPKVLTGLVFNPVG